MVLLFFFSSLKEFLPKEYTKQRGAEKRIFQVIVRLKNLLQFHFCYNKNDLSFTGVWSLYIWLVSLPENQVWRIWQFSFFPFPPPSPPFFTPFFLFLSSADLLSWSFFLHWWLFSVLCWRGQRKYLIFLSPFSQLHWNVRMCVCTKIEAHLGKSF